MKKTSLAALVAAGVLAGGMSTANAADLGVGGNCCADLEERIAELEATTVRKGNRKVSLTISGWVSQQVMFWDDGVESNAYVSDIGSTLNSHFKLSGSAQIASGLTAGYLMQVEVIGNENLALSGNVSSRGKGLDVIQSFWFVKSDTLGKISVGRQSSAADNAALLPDGSGSLAFANYIMYDINSFSIRRNGTLNNTTNWGNLATCQSFYAGGNGLGLGADCDGVPNNVVRYDTPVFAGFSGSVSWGEDDVWAFSGRYAAEYKDVKFSAAVGYFETNDTTTGRSARPLDFNGNPRGGRQSEAVQAGAYLQHVPTGLFVYGAYARDYNDRVGRTFNNGSLLGQQQKDADNYYIKAGIRQKWSPLGASVLYGEYGENNDKLGNDLWVSGVSNSNLTQYGVGFVQEIDAAAMALFMNWRHYEADATCRANNAGTGICTGLTTTGGKINFDDADLFKVGALINF